MPSKFHAGSIALRGLQSQPSSLHFSLSSLVFELENAVEFSGVLRFFEGVLSWLCCKFFGRARQPWRSAIWWRFYSRTMDWRICPSGSMKPRCRRVWRDWLGFWKRVSRRSAKGPGASCTGAIFSFEGFCLLRRPLSLLATLCEVSLAARISKTWKSRYPK